MKFEDLQAASTAIKTTPIKGKEYAQVNERIKVFRMLFPNGTISTEIVDLNTNDKGKGIVIFKATALDEEGHILGTGHAREIEGSSNINNTSFIENAETSAVGRALGMIGIGIDISIASYEEVATAIKQQEDIEKSSKTTATTAQPKAQAKTQTKTQAKKATPALVQTAAVVEPNTGEPELPFEIITEETYRDKFRKFIADNHMTDNEVLQVLQACNLRDDSPDTEWEKGLMYAIAKKGGVQT